MLGLGIDAAVGAAATLLVVSGLVKIASPAPIAATLASLWSQATGHLAPADPLWLGRLLGLAEVGLAVWITLGRSTHAAVALGVFAAGLATAGLMGALGSSAIPCGCFGGHQRSLGYAHALQLPLWVVAAWSVTRRTGPMAPLVARLAMLGVCAAVATSFHVTRAWVALAPAARRRRQTLDAGPGSRWGVQRLPT